MLDDDSQGHLLYWILGVMATVMVGLAAYTLTDIRSDVSRLAVEVHRLHQRQATFERFVTRKLDYLDTLLQERGGRPFRPQDPHGEDP